MNDDEGQKDRAPSLVVGADEPQYIEWHDSTFVSVTFDATGHTEVRISGPYLHFDAASENVSQADLAIVLEGFSGATHEINLREDGLDEVRAIDEVGAETALGARTQQGIRSLQLHFKCGDVIEVRASRIVSIRIEGVVPVPDYADHLRGLR